MASLRSKMAINGNADDPCDRNLFKARDLLDLPVVICGQGDEEPRRVTDGNRGGNGRIVFGHLHQPDT